MMIATHSCLGPPQAAVLGHVAHGPRGDAEDLGDVVASEDVNVIYGKVFALLDVMGKDSVFPAGIDHVDVMAFAALGTGFYNALELTVSDAAINGSFVGAVESAELTKG